MDICCAYFRGEFHMKKFGDADAAFLPVGNVTAFAINHEVTSIVQEDFQALGGNACSIDYVNSATVNMTLGCLKKENIAIALQGTATDLAITTVSDEEHEVIALGSLIPLAFIPLKSSVVVTDGETVPVTYVLNEDYIVTSAGIIPLVGGNIAVNDVISVSYTYGAGAKVEGITTGQQVYEVIFDGINYGEEGEQEVVARIWRVKFAPAATLALLTSGEFATIELVGTLLKDESKIGTGISKYYNFESRDIV